MQDRPMYLDGPSTWESFKAMTENFFAEQQQQIADEYPTLASLGFRYFPASDDDEEDEDADE